MAVIRRSKRKSKGSVKRNDGPFKEAAAAYRSALDGVEEYERECAEVIANLAELKDVRDVAQAKLEIASKTLLRGSRPMRASGLKVSRQERAGKRAVDVQALMAKHPNVWTHDGVVKVNVSSLDRLVASGVVDSGDAEKFTTRGSPTEVIHIEVQEQKDGQD
jgi:hypothetical protein